MAKPKTTGDAIALLKADHRKVEGLFEKFESTKGSERKTALAKEICTELMIHATIEEEIFYPACKEAVDEDQMNEAYVEHDGAKVMIAELLASSPDQQFYQLPCDGDLGAQVRGFARHGGHHLDHAGPADPAG